ncbi:hypothetical protein ACQKMD_20615 [Viridibacillus sp. NPDC096237]
MTSIKAKNIYHFEPLLYGLKISQKLQKENEEVLSIPHSLYLI